MVLDDPYEKVIEPRRGRNPQVENHNFRASGHPYWSYWFGWVWLRVCGKRG